MTERLHFIGISGIGMSALARIAMARGTTVSGSSDRDTALLRKLTLEGALTMIGHRPGNILSADDGAGGDRDGELGHRHGKPSVDRVVVTSAIAQNNSELRAAREHDIPVIGRGELLAEYFNRCTGIAVAGTHGKTTVTSMLATIFETAGLDPTVAVGGERRETGTNFRCGTSEYFITEADESDGSFLYLRPTFAIVNNIENDHVASDDAVGLLIEQFRTFLDRVPANGRAVIGIDEPTAALLADEARIAQTLTYGFDSRADLRGEHPEFDGYESRCDVVRGGAKLGEIALGVPGVFNLQNALAATAVALECGIAFATIARALAKFGGVRRRFDILASGARMTVVDDYAHHPTAVEATIAAARRAQSGPVIVAFQPHRYTRTEYLATDFTRSLAGADRVYLTEVYAASEQPIAGISERTIGDPLAARGVDVVYVRRAELVERLLRDVPSGAMMLMLGAGDITGAAHELAAALPAPVAVA